MIQLPLVLAVTGLLASVAIFVSSIRGMTWPMGVFVLLLGAMALLGPVVARFPRTSDPSTMMLHREAWGRLLRSRPRWLLVMAVLAGVQALAQGVAFIFLHKPGTTQILPLDSRVLSSALMAVFSFHVIWYWPTGTRGE